MRRYAFLTWALYRAIWGAVRDWWSWARVDLDDYYCCDGTPYRECGCGGMTNREAIKLNYGFDT